MTILLDDGRSPTLHLFKNSPTLGNATVETDFVECDFPGYSPIVLAGFSIADITAMHSGRRFKTPIYFTMTGAGPPQTANGWWIDLELPSTVMQLFFCEIFATPQTVTNIGDTVVVNLQFFANQGTET